MSTAIYLGTAGVKAIILGNKGIFNKVKPAAEKLGLMNVIFS